MNESFLDVLLSTYYNLGGRAGSIDAVYLFFEINVANLNMNRR